MRHTLMLFHNYLVFSTLPAVYTSHLLSLRSAIFAIMKESDTAKWTVVRNIKIGTNMWSTSDK